MTPTINRSAVFFLTVMLGVAPLQSQDDQQRNPRRVVFVCEHGAAKSVIATAHFNKLAQDRGLPYRAVARGTNPDAAFSEPVIIGLHRSGLKEPDGKPELVDARELATADRVVTLGCKLPESSKVKTHMDWSDVPSPGADYDAAQAEVVRHVVDLINELSKESTK